MALKEVGLKFVLDGAQQAKTGLASITAVLGPLAIGLAALKAIKGVFNFMAEGSELSREYEEALSGVRRTVDGLSKNDLAEMRKAFMDLSPEVGKSATELANTAAAAGQLGIAKSEIQGFTEAVAKGSTAMPEFTGGADELATTIAKLGNMYGIAKEDITDFANQSMSSLNALSNATAANAKQISDFAQSFTGAASLGFKPEQVFALGAAFTSLGQDASDAGTRMQSALGKLFGDEGAMAKAAELVGKTPEEFKKWASTDVLGAITAVITAIDGTSTSSHGLAVQMREIKRSEEETAELERQHADVLGALEDATSDYERAVSDADQALDRMNDQFRNAAELMRRVDDVQRDITRGSEDITGVWDDYATAQKRLNEDMARTDDLEERIRIQRELEDAYQEAVDRETELTRQIEDNQSRQNELYIRHDEIMQDARESEDAYREALNAQSAAMDAANTSTSEADRLFRLLNEPVYELVNSSDEARSGIDKLTVANEIFGQVGGRAMLALVKGMGTLTEALETGGEAMQSADAHLNEFSINTERYGFRIDAFRNEWSNLKIVFGDVENAGLAILSDVFQPILQLAREWLDVVPGWLSSWQESSAIWAELKEAVLEFVETFWQVPESAGLAGALFGQVMDGIAQIAAAFFQVMTGLVRFFQSDWDVQWGMILSVAISGWSDITDAFHTAWAALMAWWDGDGGQEFQAKFAALWAEIKEWLSNWWDNTLIPAMQNMAVAMAEAVIDAFWGVFETGWESLTNRFKTGLAGWYNMFADFFSGEDASYAASNGFRAGMDSRGNRTYLPPNGNSYGDRRSSSQSSYRSAALARTPAGGAASYSFHFSGIYDARSMREQAGRLFPALAAAAARGGY